MYNKIIFGAGIYGLYSALHCAQKGENILVLEYDEAAFKRATYINQARVHLGYHYPRSLSTAIKSRNYFDKFNEDYDFCVNSEFEKIYSTSKNFSWTNAKQFKKFCESANIECEAVENEKYFKPDACDGVFKTKEYTYDAQILKNYFLDELSKFDNVTIKYSFRIKNVEKGEKTYTIYGEDGESYETGFILNATYASVNQIHNIFGFGDFSIKYELCEIILCKPRKKLEDVGITVMDGPFFSIMPFGKTGLHSLTSVTFTPHETSYDMLPTFACQKGNEDFCRPEQLGNCNDCKNKPETAFPFMERLARKYLNDEFDFEYVDSLFSMKPILKSSEIDDSRPTVIRVMNECPKFVSVLSGKINTVYDLEEVLND